MKIFDANQLVSIKQSRTPCALQLYNMKQLHISNIFFNCIKKSNDFSIIQLTPSTTIDPNESSKDFFFLPISKIRKTLDIDVVILFTAAKKLNIAKVRMPVVFSNNRDQIDSVMVKILDRLAWEKDTITMSLAEFSKIPCPEIGSIRVKYWNHMLISFNEYERRAFIYAPKELLKKTMVFLGDGREGAFEEFHNYFTLGHEFALSVDYTLMDRRDELIDSLSKINVLLKKLQIDYQFELSKDWLDQLSPEQLESIQSKIMAKS